MSPSHPTTGTIPPRFPRVSGDEPQPPNLPVKINEFSPRERG